LTSHNLISLLSPVAIIFPFGDNAMDHTAKLSPYRHSSPICVPFSRSHSRSEPPKEHVMSCRSPGKCTTPPTRSVWPSIVWCGMIAGILLVEEDMVRTTDRVWERSLPES
jgi:hypothetical protein